MKKYLLFIFTFSFIKSMNYDLRKNLFKDIKSCNSNANKLILDLVNKKIDLDFTNINLRTPLIIAVIHGCKKIVKKLVKFDANVYKKDRYGFNALDYAYKKLKKAKSLKKIKRFKKIISILIKEKLNLKLISKCSSGDLDGVLELIDKKANINFQNRFKETPLIKAVNSGNKDIVEVLIKNGADISLEDFLNNSALDYAILKSKESDNNIYRDIAYILRENRFNLKDKKLLDFVKSGNIKKVLKLLNKGSDPNLSYYDNHNILMMAVKNKDIDMVKMLVLNGADPNLKDDHGLSALDYAIFYLDKEQNLEERSKYQDIINFLDNYN